MRESGGSELDGTAGLTVPPGAAYLAIPFDYAAFKETHNSYDRGERLTRQLEWNVTARCDGGCRGLELDIHRNGERGDWSVSHTGEYDGAPERQLRTYLERLRAWARARPGHDPITVHLDVKNGGSVRTGADHLDAYIDAALGADRLFTPRHLLGRTGTNLVEAATDGWPTVGDLRGRFLICLSGDEYWKGTYARMDLRSRLCFSDFALAPGEWFPVHVGSRVIVNLQYSPLGTLTAKLRWVREHRAFVSRVFGVNSRTAWNRVRPAGANMLSTNSVRGARWATVGPAPFASTLDEYAA